LRLSFSYPTGRPQWVEMEPGSSGDDGNQKRPTKRWQLLDDPDILLAACVVVATKYVYPFDTTNRTPESEANPLALRMNWRVWMDAFSQTSRKNIKIFDPASVNKFSAQSLSEEEMDAYLDWYENTRIHREKGE
jgi:RNA polymerase I-specific transcription initiation factor RRN7